MPPIEMLGRNSHLSHSMLFIYFYNLATGTGSEVVGCV